LQGKGIQHALPFRLFLAEGEFSLIETYEAIIKLRIALPL
jgi:hypothetical protein